MGSLARRIKKTQASIDRFKEDIDGPHQISSIFYLEHQLEKLLLKEEVYWRQRSRNNWLGAGDKNTSFFHKSASVRRSRNYILSLRKEDNTVTSNRREIEDMVINFYASLLSSQRPDEADLNIVTNRIPKMMSSNMNAKLDICLFQS